MDPNAIGDATRNGFNEFVSFLPELFGAIVILLIGWLVAKALYRLVTAGLRATQFDEALLNSHAGGVVERMVGDPSRFVGKLVYWLVFLAGVSIALSVLGIEALNNFLNAVYAYLPHIVAAVLIFIVAGAVSTFVVAFVNRVMGDSPLAKGIAAVLPTIIMSIAVFMMLNELQIATDIVNVTYTAMIGSIALAAALAFGLGGRDVAARMLDTAYEAGRRHVGTAKQEVSRANDNAKRQAARVRRGME